MTGKSQEFLARERMSPKVQDFPIALGLRIVNHCRANCLVTTIPIDEIGAREGAIFGTPNDQ